MKNCIWYNKLFVTDRYFTIAVRKRSNVNILENTKFKANCVVPANRQKWVADPILVDFENKTYMFYEAVLGDKGHIEMVEIMDDCTFSEATVILKDDCHYSYPFIFQHEGKWYMIPESSAEKEVRLYQAVSFPQKWELHSVLLNEKAVDTTVFEKNEQLYLLTFFICENCERVIPHAYKVNIVKEKVELEEIVWDNYDELKVRGAGAIFRANGALYRPSQISQEQQYGDGVAFYEVNVLDSYKEKLIKEMGPTDVIVSGYLVDGLHTYCSSKKFEAIDIRCCVVNWFKPIHKILSAFKQ